MEEINIKENLGSIIKRYRKHLNLTQQKLGDLIGINQRQIALIESGKSFPMLSTMIKLAEVFNCSVSDFFEVLSKEEEQNITNTINDFINHCSPSQLKQIYSVVKMMKYGV